jgi:hypothetical protein
MYVGRGKGLGWVPEGEGFGGEGFGGTGIRRERDSEGEGYRGQNLLVLMRRRVLFLLGNNFQLHLSTTGHDIMAAQEQGYEPGVTKTTKVNS